MSVTYYDTDGCKLVQVSANMQISGSGLVNPTVLDVGFAVVTTPVALASACNVLGRLGFPPYLQTFTFCGDDARALAANWFNFF